jgi:hypothetical protein
MFSFTSIDPIEGYIGESFVTNWPRKEGRKEASIDKPIGR